MNGVFDDDFDPTSVNGHALAHNVAVMGKVHQIAVTVNASDKEFVNIEVHYIIKTEDWEFALKHSIEREEEE